MSTLNEHDELCIGVDVGGTFTDVVLTDAEHTWRAKSPTTPGDLGRGRARRVRARRHARRAPRSRRSSPRVRRFGLGTTAVTNVLASRAGRRVGLITTQGLRGSRPARTRRRVPTTTAG